MFPLTFSLHFFFVHNLAWPLFLFRLKNTYVSTKVVCVCACISTTFFLIQQFISAFNLCLLERSTESELQFIGIWRMLAALSRICTEIDIKSGIQIISIFDHGHTLRSCRLLSSNWASPSLVHILRFSHSPTHHFRKQSKLSIVTTTESTFPESGTRYSNLFSFNCWTIRNHMLTISRTHHK